MEKLKPRELTKTKPSSPRSVVYENNMIKALKFGDKVIPINLNEEIVRSGDKVEMVTVDNETYKIFYINHEAVINNILETNRGANVILVKVNDVPNSYGTLSYGVEYVAFLRVPEKGNISYQKLWKALDKATIPRRTSIIPPGIQEYEARHETFSYGEVYSSAVLNPRTHEIISNQNLLYTKHDVKTKEMVTAVIISSGLKNLMKLLRVFVTALPVDPLGVLTEPKRALNDALANTEAMFDKIEELTFDSLKKLGYKEYSVEIKLKDLEPHIDTIVQNVKRRYEKITGVEQFTTDFLKSRLLELEKIQLILQPISGQFESNINIGDRLLESLLMEEIGMMYSLHLLNSDENKGLLNKISKKLKGENIEKHLNTVKTSLIQYFALTVKNNKHTIADIIKVLGNEDLAKTIEKMETNVTKSKELLSKYIVSRLLDANLMLTEEEMKQITLGEDKEKLDKLIDSFKNDNTFLYKIYTYLNNLEAQSVLPKENNKEIKQDHKPQIMKLYSVYDPRRDFHKIFKNRLAPAG